MVNNNLSAKFFSISQYFLIMVPMISVYIPTIVYPVNNDVGSNVSFRPPGYVFAIIWPILLFLLGISWFVRRKLGYFINFTYILLTLLLSIWFILYDNNKYYGLIDIIVCLLITIFLFFYNCEKKFNKLASLTLLPLIIWLVFASILNIASIE